MAQILPPATNLGADIGKALGMGFQNTFEPAMQQQYQRGQIQNALSQAEKVAGDPNSDSFQKSIALIKAFAGYPGAEKFAGTLIPQMISYSERKAGNNPGQPGAVGKGNSNTQQVQSAPTLMDLVPPNKQGNISDPNGIPNFVAPYSPEQIQEIQVKADQLGYTPEARDRFVKDAMLMNENARAGYNDLLTSYSAQQKVRSDTLENQQAFTDYLKNNAKEFTDPDEMQLALETSEKYQNEPSFARRLDKVKQEMRPYQSAKNSLKTTLQRPVFGFNNDRLQKARNGVKMMIDRGQKDQLRLMIANGGHGDIEEALLINPLPEKMEKSLKGIQKFQSPLAYVKNIEPDSPDYDKQLERGRNVTDKQKNVVGDFLTKNISPGTYNEPGTNLLLTRKYLMDKGLDWAESGKLIQDSIGKGNIKLDPHQEIDYQKLGYPPLQGEEYFQNVLNYVIFGKE